MQTKKTMLSQLGSDISQNNIETYSFYKDDYLNTLGYIHNRNHDCILIVVQISHEIFKGANIGTRDYF